ncbi:hypothetical protein E8E14_003809 [Neopestalotiopsis sp. 37M]|nr:hypothetical protein E8E14_003809 [Neopestalotiopsis sp. 37M]
MASDPTSTLNEVFVLMGIGLLVILLRLYARWEAVGFKSALAFKVVSKYSGLANNGMTDEYRQALSPDSDEYKNRIGGSKTQIEGWVVYVLLLWIIKAALCTMFLRLTERLGTYRTRINIGFGVILASWIIVTVCILASCSPINKNWQIYPNPGLTCQPAISRVNVFVTLGFNVATDLYLLTIPIPMLWSAQIQLWKKLGLIVLFSGGIFVMMAGILRCVLIISNDVTGAQDAAAWAIRETFVAVVTSNVPLIFPLMRKWIGNTLGSFSSRKDSRSRTLGAYPGSIPLPDRSWHSRKDNDDHQFQAAGGDAFAFAGSRDRITESSADKGIKVEMNVEISSSNKRRNDSESNVSF